MTKSPLRMVLIVLFLSFLSNSVNSNCSYFLYHFLPCEISCYKILDDFFFFIYCILGDQFWVFIGRTDVEVETPILWPPHVKS